MTRILVVEDNADLAFAVVSTLETDGYEVSVASSGPDGLRRVGEFTPDLIILDLMLPGFDGFRVLRTLRDAGAEVPVLILTARGAEEDKVRGFRLGADDYVTKPFGAMELLARVGALLRRAQRARSPVQTASETPAVGAASDASSTSAQPEHPVERFGDVEVNRATRVVRRAGAVVALTLKEYDLLVALIDRRGAVATRADLLREVWGYSHEVSSRTIDIHVVELRRKLEPQPSEPRHVLTVWKVGYRFEP